MFRSLTQALLINNRAIFFDTLYRMYKDQILGEEVIYLQDRSNKSKWYDRVWHLGQNIEKPTLYLYWMSNPNPWQDQYRNNIKLFKPSIICGGYKLELSPWRESIKFPQHTLEKLSFIHLNWSFALQTIWPGSGVHRLWTEVLGQLSWKIRLWCYIFILSFKMQPFLMTLYPKKI